MPCRDDLCCLLVLVWCATARRHMETLANTIADIETKLKANGVEYDRIIQDVRLNGSLWWSW